MKFQEAYLRLNDRQRQAVDVIYGPVLVLAGAGTGKTQVLSTRVTRLIQSEAQVSPDNILCLTYTDAGAKTMRNRLVQFIGPAAYRITISTFHAFCSDIIQYNMDYFGFRKLEPIDELEDIRVIYDIINALPATSSLRRIKGDPYYEVYRMKNLFSMMKEEGWTAGSIEAACNRWMDPLWRLALDAGKWKIEYANDPETYKMLTTTLANEYNIQDYVYKKGNKSRDIIAGDPKWDKLDDEDQRCKLIIEAAKHFDTYQAKLKDMNRYDFSDMIHWVIDAFRSSHGDWLLQQYQERYQFVLLDEMQDTTGPQMELLNLLMGYWDEPNIFAVGDIDQTLYAFSGARIQNILDYIRKYSPQVISLNENYRSAQEILSLAKNVISNNKIRLGDRIDIDDPSALVSKVDVHAHPQCIECKNTLEEESIIVDMIRQRLEDGMAPDSIAVLYRKHRQAENIIKMLSSMGVKVNARKRINVLEDPTIRQLMNILRFCSDHNNLGEDRIDLLYEILHYPYFGFNHVTINQFIKTENPENIVLSALITIGKESSVPEFIMAAVTKTGMLQYVINHSQSREKLVYLSTFIDWVRSYCFKNPFAKMITLLEDIDKMIGRDIPITCQDIYVGDAGVTFSTVHGAKGLEWDTVFLIGCTSNEWEKSRGRTDSYRYPDTISKAEGDDAMEAARRLFYVAITRAKQELVISYPSHNNDGKDLEVSQFVIETGLAATQTSLAGNSQRFYDKLSGLLNISQPSLKITDKDYLATLIDGYTLSPTAVGKFLKCPVTWYFENLIRTPFVPTGALVFGNAFHYAMKKYYDSKQLKDPLQHLEDWFMEDMRRHQGQINKQEYDRRCHLGIELIPAYYEKIIRYSNTVTLNEFKARNITLPNGVPIKGDIDKIEFNGNLVDIVDYKTGMYSYVKNEIKPADDKSDGGDIWRQLIIYSLIVDHGIKSKPWKTNSIRVEMIDSEYMGAIPVELSSAHQDTVLAQIKTVWDKIQSLDFLTGCGEPECKWCNFINENI